MHFFKQILCKLPYVLLFGTSLVGLSVFLSDQLGFVLAVIGYAIMAVASLIVIGSEVFGYRITCFETPEKEQ
jgi:hypothetical protein